MSHPTTDCCACGQPQETFSESCTVCEKGICEWCLEHNADVDNCIACDQLVCPKCSEKCDYCGHIVCKDCAVKIAIYGYTICPNCLDNIALKADKHERDKRILAEISFGFDQLLTPQNPMDNIHKRNDNLQQLLMRLKGLIKDA